MQLLLGACLDIERVAA